MTWRRRASRPVPLTPTHRRDWRTFWRRCTCGLTSPCVDRLVPATLQPFPPRTATATHPSAGSLEERSPRYPALIEYLATVPFPVHCGVAVLRIFPTEPTPSSDFPKPSLPRAPADHPGGHGALGGPGSRPCPGFRAGAAPLPDFGPHTPAIGRTRPHTPTIGRTRPPDDWPHPSARPDDRPHAPTIGRTRRRSDPAAARQEPDAERRDRCGNANQTNGGQSNNGSKRPKAAGEGWGRPHQGCGGRREPRPFHPVLSRSWIRATVGGGERAGERAGRPGAGDLRAGSNGGRRGRLPTLGGRPAMAYHHINLSCQH